MILPDRRGAFAGLHRRRGLPARALARSAEGWIVLAFLLCGLGGAAWQIRGATFATAFAIPFGRVGRRQGAARLSRKASAHPRAGFAGVAASSAAAAWASAGGALQARLTPAGRDDQLRSAQAPTRSLLHAGGALRSLPLQRRASCSTSSRFGADILVWTDHSRPGRRPTIATSPAR